MRQDRIDNIVAVMGMIDRFGSARVSQIAESTSLSGGTISVILAYLSDNNFATIGRKDTDGRRRLHYTLTESGVYYLVSIAGMANPPEPVRTVVKESRPICGDWRVA